MGWGEEAAAEGAAVFSFNGARMPTPEYDPELYNFRSPGFLSQADLRQLALTHDKFVQHLGARLSTFLRIDCSVRISKLSSSTFAKFSECIQSPTHVTLFQIEPLRGVGVLDMSLPLALTIADRLLGGRGSVMDVGRSLTEIEIALVEDATQLILVEWSEQWQDDDWHLQPRCIGTDTSGRFLQTSSPESVTLTIDLEVVIGECVEQLQMGVPFSMIEVIVKKMQQGRREDAGTKKIEWRKPYDGIAVPLTAELVVREMTMREVLDLRPGDVLEMPRELIESACVRLSRTPEFIATVGIENGRVAVQLVKRTSSE
jgi:flagellar motor switch protein FliM